MAQFNFEAIGTKWQIDIYRNISKEKETVILSQINKRIEIFDQAYSRFRKDSLVTKMSEESGTFLMPDDAKPMLELYYDLYKITDGYFTPLVGNLLSDLGYDAEYSLRQKGKLQAVPAWEDIIEYKHPNIRMKMPAILDFGAGGKGYLIDLVAKLLEENGTFEYCIDAGGDILHKGKSLIRVGLENPENTRQVIGVYGLKNKSICGSSGNRRAWGSSTHIVNPKTLSSQKNILAVWVVAQTALLADALATCLFFVPASTLQSSYKFEYVLIKKDHSFEKSPNFSGEMFVH
jgi:thiamine biosynthesis lipoprotein